MDVHQVRSLTPHFPSYDIARHFLRILDGVPYSTYRSTYDAILEGRGTPQEQADWTDPNIWIPERLSNEQQALALRMWRESDGELNPRYTLGCWSLSTRHNLLAKDAGGTLKITDTGQRFLDEPEGQTVAEIDAYEGALTMLRLVAERGPAKSSEFLPQYADFCRRFTNYRSEGVFRNTQYNRLINLIDRGYVSRSAQTYEITDAGVGFLETYAQLLPGWKAGSRQLELQRVARDIGREARDQLAKHLSTMDPFKFEELIQFLLEEMGYTDVETTSPVNDKGVDVVGNVELGVSSVREVIQVKRRKGNLGRPVLDQLRGSLYRWNAVRGTIITTGGFTAGVTRAAFERGAAPITLIDGDKLLDLLVEHEIGVSKESVDYIEFDASKLEQFESEEEEEL
ncbi:MAG TPA: restriction endonuclease [Anaerolineae bacterium]|nr:restriction endonuclease [Anaerolineae bacterium]